MIAKIYGVDISIYNIVLTIPIIMISSIILNAFALFISSVIKQSENFATVMNFVIFPMFFLSSALYPLWKIKDSSVLLFNISLCNPFTYIVESIRFSLYLKFDSELFLILGSSLIVCLIMAFVGFKSKKINQG